MYDIVALGEVLIDFTPSEHEPLAYKQNAGGAPANVLAMAAKLGKNTAFIGKVGNDQFGHFLKQTLEEASIDTTGLVFSEDIRTTLAFVHLSADGDRSFSFYRNPGADMSLTKEEVQLSIIEKTKLFHFGSLSLTHQAVAEATFTALDYAKEQHILVSYDPNLRESLWSSLENAKQMMLKGMNYAHIVKLSEEELTFLTHKSTIEESAEQLFTSYSLKLLLVTMGEKGCFYQTSSFSGFVPAYKVNVKDTTAAGDSFFAAILSQLVEVIDGEQALDSITQQQLCSIVCYANATGALTTTKKGAIVSLPSREEIDQLIALQG